MDYLKVHESPSARIDYLVTAFKGWPDAGEGASSAIRYLLRKLPGKKCAEIDSEDFYDFTQIRPQTSITRDGTRLVKWPTNELFYWATNEPSKSLMLFLGVEPNLRWKAYSNTVLDVAQSWGVKSVVHLGSLLDAVPHTRDIRVTGSSDKTNLKHMLEEMGVKPSNYQGPTGITSAIMEICAARGIGFTSMWGHTPHYLQAAPNYRVGYSLIYLLSRLVGIPIELDELRAAANTFDQEVEKAVTKDNQIDSYIQKLERSYDEASILTQTEIPQAGDVVKELEEFLKEQKRGN